MTVRMILDVDTGIDDAMAIAMAVHHPDIELVAVVTVAGNVGLELTTRNTLRVLEWLDASAVPVVAGAAAPLSGVLREAGHFHGEDGLGGAQLPAAKGTAAADGVAFLVDQVREDTTLVCTGPLTNLALAIQRDATLPSRVREVVLMGGAAKPPGNVTAVAEFNIYADPVAAAIVFEQPWQLTMVGLDVTNQVVFTRTDRAFVAQQTSKQAQLVYQVTRHHFDRLGYEAIALHDPLAVAVALDPSLVFVSAAPVQVETHGDLTLGQTVVDFRKRRPSRRTARVCLDVDARRAREAILSAIGVQPPPE